MEIERDLDLVVSGLVALGLLFAGLGKKSSSESTFLMANRRIGFWSLTSTLVMTELNTATILAFGSIGFIAGVWGLLLPFIFLIGLLFYAFVVAKKWKEFNGLSISRFFYKRYGKEVGLISSLALLASSLCFSATCVHSLAILFRPLFPNTQNWILTALLVTLPVLLSIRGGLMSVIRTDVFSLLLILLLLFFPFMAFLSLKAGHLPRPTLEQLAEGQEQLPLLYIVSLSVLTIGVAPIKQDH